MKTGGSGRYVRYGGYFFGDLFASVTRSKLPNSRLEASCLAIREAAKLQSRVPSNRYISLSSEY